MPFVENRRAERCLCEDKLIDNTINRPGIVNRVVLIAYTQVRFVQYNKIEMVYFDSTQLVYEQKYHLMIHKNNDLMC